MTYFTVNKHVFGIEKDLHGHLYRIFYNRKEIYKCRGNSYQCAIRKFTKDVEIRSEDSTSQSRGI